MPALALADPDSARAMAAGFGREPLDLLVCNAGIYPDKGHEPETGYPAALWAGTFAVNVTGVFLTVRALLTNLRAGPGKIAILSSFMGADAPASGGSYIYRASKAAALSLGRNLAADLAVWSVPVGIYHPVRVGTDMGGPGRHGRRDGGGGARCPLRRALARDHGLFRWLSRRPHPVLGAPAGRSPAIRLHGAPPAPMKRAV